MSVFLVSYHPRAKKQLDKIASENVRRNLMRRIVALEENPRPRQSTKLRGRRNRFRIRKGSYRIVYTIKNSEINILEVKHRRDVYR